MMDDNLKVTAQSAAHSDTVDSVTSNVAHNDSNDSEQMSIDNDVSNSSSSSTTSSRHEPSSVPSSDQNSSNDVDADLPAFSNGRSFDSPSFSIAQSVDSPVISNGRSFNSPPLSNGRSVDSPVASSSGFNEQDHNRNQHRNNQNHHERRGFNQRRNLKSMEDQSVDAEVLQARREEEDRLKRLLEAHNRQRQQLLHQQQQLQRQQLQQHLQQHQSDEIVLSSDDEVNESNNLNIHHTAEVNATRTLNQLYSNMTPQTLEPKFIASSASSNFIHTETIDLSDGEEDVRQSTVLGERGMLSGAKEIPENGLHTDDLLNTKDSFGRVLVNVAHPENEPDLLLSPHLSNIVKPHQIGGVRFLYDCVVESIEKYRTTSGLGCILAHSMGLGKTLQTIAFIEVFLRGTGAKHVLCIVPVNTIQNWMSEFEMWLPRRPLFSTPEFEKELADEQEMAAKQEEGGYPANQGSRYRSFSVFSLSECKTQADRARELMKWRKEGGVMFMGYEIYRAMLDEQALRNSISKSGSSICSNQAEALIDKIRSIILDPGPDLVVCDEGHRIKNAKAAVSKALKEIRTKRRIVLTGYPLQNNLLEYWCMVDFVRPGYLGTRNEFSNLFEKPITNGQCVDSTPQDKVLMRKRSHVLYQLLKGFVQRRSQSILTKSLPTKFEYVIYVRMTDIQKRLFLAYFNYLKTVLPKTGKANPLVVFSVCVRIWNHPDIFHHSLNANDMNPNEDMDIPIEPTTARTRVRGKRTASETFESIDNDTFSLPSASSASQLFSRLLNCDWARSMLADYKAGTLEHGYKMSLLFNIIDETIKCGDRLLVFSHSLKTLDVIERFLSERRIPNRSETFRRLTNYFRLDGSTGPTERERFINNFNSNPNIVLFLLSTRAGSLGINLIGANRIVVFDASWNPCHDAQAACRIYRFGQKKKCYIYRLVCDNTLEKRIYDRQITKQGLSNRVVDELNSDSYITMNELTRLVEGLDEFNETPIIQYQEHEIEQYNDHIMQRICRNYNECLTKQPFEHESLLLDVEETKLSKDEKRIAEIEFKMERTYGPRTLNLDPNFHAGAAGETIIQPGGAPCMELAPDYQYHQPPPASNGMFNYRSVRMMPGALHPAAGQTISECIVSQDLNILDVNEQLVRLNCNQKVIFYRCPPSLIIVKTLNGRVIPMYEENFQKYFGQCLIAPIGAHANHIPLVPIHSQPSHHHNGAPEVIDLSSDDELGTIME